MSVTLKLANVWRVLKDVNLDAIRESADARFVILLVGDELDDVQRIRAALSPGDEASPHPWIFPASAASGLPTLPQRPLMAVLVSRSAELSPALVSARQVCAHDKIGVITVIVDGESSSQVVPAVDEIARLVVPSVDSKLARDLGGAILRAAGPDWRLALARQLPVVRAEAFATTIEETAQANASYALTTGIAEAIPVLTAPMNLGDMIVLTKNQLVMSYRLALAAGMNGEPRQLIPEILGVLGGGLLFRQVARQLVGLIPVIGIAPKVAVAYGGTYAIGRAVSVWATEGRAASTDALQRYAQEGLARGRELARALTARARETSTTRAARRAALQQEVPALGKPRSSAS